MTSMIKIAMEKVLVVGAGLTGSLTSSLLRRELGAGAKIEIWDKSRGTGGRMNTSRSPLDGKCTVDLGAQYVSATPQYAAQHARYYDELQAAGVLQPLTAPIEGANRHVAGSEHFVSARGIGAIAKHYLSQAGAENMFGERVTRVDQEGSQWRVTSDKGTQSTCECLILTMPVPQILQIDGHIRDILDASPELRSKLEAVQYSARFALGLFYEPGTPIDVPWGAKYVQGDDCIVFISIDNRKRGDEGGCPSVAVHSSVPFGLRHLEEDMAAVCREHLQPALARHLPHLPAPAATKPHKWRYSQVFKAFAGTPGCVVLQQEPLIVLAGDAFSHSNFDGCVESAEAVLRAVGAQAKL